MNSEDYYKYYGISLDTTQPCPAPNQCVISGDALKQSWGCKNKKEENPMASYASAQIIADTTERDQRDFARERLRTIKYAKEAAFEKQFGLTDDEDPKTPAEFVKRISDGKYTIDKEKMDKKTYAPSNYIRWRDPSKVEDRDGFKAAVEKMTVAYTSAKDKAILAPASDLLATVESFDGWTLS